MPLRFGAVCLALAGGAGLLTGVAAKDFQAQKFRWGFESPGTCLEAGYVLGLPECEFSEANVGKPDSGCSPYNFRIIDFGVTRSALGLPLGTVANQAYMFMNDRTSLEQTTMVIDPVQGTVTFKGKSANAKGGLWLNTVDENNALQVHLRFDGIAEIPGHCQGEFYMTSKRPGSVENEVPTTVQDTLLVPRQSLTYVQQQFAASHAAVEAARPVGLLLGILLATSFVMLAAAAAMSWRRSSHRRARQEEQVRQRLMTALDETPHAVTPVATAGEGGEA
jgi:hypothetical protein